MSEYLAEPAQDGDGPEIRDLLVEGGCADAAMWDWSQVAPWWLVVRLDDAIIGACQVAPARPIARIEWLTSSPALPRLKRLQVIRALCLNAYASIAMQGVNRVSFVVSSGDKEWLDLLQKRGAVVVDAGFVCLMGVRCDDWWRKSDGRPERGADG